MNEITPTNARRSSSRGMWFARGALVALAPGFAMMPASAHAGFLEQLFGIQPAPEAPQQVLPPPGYMYAPRRAPRPAHRRVYVETISSGKQTPTDLMHDKTLRRGDAVMMKDGLHVYAGGPGGTHAAADFPPLGRSGLPRREQTALAAVEPSRSDAPSGAAVTGRSAAVDTTLVGGRMITDARGKQLRYIGP